LQVKEKLKGDYSVMSRNYEPKTEAGKKCKRTDQRMKKYVRYKEGAEMYSMCQSKFERLAKDAKATYKVDKLVLVNIEILERYLETFRIVE